MQTVGIVLISIGVWIVYCGYHGISPIDTGIAVVTNPDKARQIIADAQKSSAAKLTSLGINMSGASGDAINPFDTKTISDDFEEHKARGSGGGVDFAVPSGTPIPAPAGGLVAVKPSNGKAGNMVSILHKSGYTSIFMHLSKFKVLSGSTVKTGQILGLSGGTAGSAGAGSSTGAHIHWSVLDPKGQQVDPLKNWSKL